MQKNKFHEMLPVLYQEYSISFEIKPTDTVTGWSSIIRIGNGDCDNCKYGARSPALFFVTETTSIAMGSKGSDRENLGKILKRS